MIDQRLRYNSLGFLKVVDPPTEAELAAYYSQHYYQTEQSNYRKEYSQDERRYFDLKIAQKAALAASFASASAPGSMLDVGCGEGFTLAWFERHNWNVEGIDHSTAGLQNMNPQLLDRVESGDLFAILDRKISDGDSYNLVWLSHVLEHVVDPVGLLKSLRRLVADGGVLVVSVPNDGTAFQEFLYRSGKVPERSWIALPDHLAYFTEASLRTTAEATGWDCREIIGDFPIDLFLLHEGSNYVADRSNGPAAHAARLDFELLLGKAPHKAVNDFYAAMARVGLGRSLTAFLTPKT